MPTISEADLLRFAQDLLQTGGIAAGPASVVADSLVQANLRGHDSHGVMRIPQYVDLFIKGKVRGNVPLQILDETPALLAADAGWGFGQVQALGCLVHQHDVFRRGRGGLATEQFEQRLVPLVQRVGENLPRLSRGAVGEARLADVVLVDDEANASGEPLDRAHVKEAHAPDVGAGTKRNPVEQI